LGERWFCHACYQEPAVCAFGERHSEQRNKARDGAKGHAEDAMVADTRGVRAKYSDLLLRHDVAVRQAADVAEVMLTCRRAARLAFSGRIKFCKQLRY